MSSQEPRFARALSRRGHVGAERRRSGWLGGKALGATALAVALLSCSGGRSKEPACVAELTFVEGRFSEQAPFKGRGSGGNQAEAIENTCWDYCYGADEDFDAKYSLWFDAKASKAHREAYASDRRKGKSMAIGFQEDRGLRREFDQCVSGCQTNVAGKQAGFSATARCGNP